MKKKRLFTQFNSRECNEASSYLQSLKPNKWQKKLNRKSYATVDKFSRGDNENRAEIKKYENEQVIKSFKVAHAISTATAHIFLDWLHDL